MSDAAVARGRARLDAFRASRKHAQGTNVKSERTDSTDVSSVGASLEVMEDRAVRAEALVNDIKPSDVIVSVRSDVSTTETADATTAEETSRTAEAATERERAVRSEKKTNAHSDLANMNDESTRISERATSMTAETETKTERRSEGLLGATTSTDRAREQYERVMRAINGNGEIDASLFEPVSASSLKSEEEEEEEMNVEAEPLATCTDLDAIIAQVQRNDVIGGAPARAVRDDQSEIAMLQEVIDDMTSEKLGLLRGLQRSQAMVDDLVGENEALMQRFNETKSQLSALQGEYDRLWMQRQSERANMPGDVDALQMGGPDANERVQALAAEVVNLEERLQEFDEVKSENEALKLEVRRCNARTSEVELVLEATQEQSRLFKERFQGSEFMKTIELLEGDDAAFLCAWLKRKDTDVLKEARATAISKTIDRERSDALREAEQTSGEVDEEQIELLSSIDTLLEQLQVEKTNSRRQLTSANESIEHLKVRNELLESQLAKVLNQLAGTQEDLSDEDDAKPRRRGLFSMFARRR